MNWCSVSLIQFVVGFLLIVMKMKSTRIDFEQLKRFLVTTFLSLATSPAVCKQLVLMIKSERLPIQNPQFLFFLIANA